MIACLASQPSFPAYTDGGNECWLVSWRTSHMSEAPCQPCKSIYFFVSTSLCHPHFLGKSHKKTEKMRLFVLNSINWYIIIRTVKFDARICRIEGEGRIPSPPFSPFLCRAEKRGFLFGDIFSVGNSERIVV